MAACAEEVALMKPMKSSIHRQVQYFSDDYLDRCRAMTHKERLAFVESFRLLHEPALRKRRKVGLNVGKDFLDVFRRKCALEGVPYQTQIKRLMSAWLGFDLR